MYSTTISQLQGVEELYFVKRGTLTLKLKGGTITFKFQLITFEKLETLLGSFTFDSVTLTLTMKLMEVDRLTSDYRYLVCGMCVCVCVVVCASSEQELSSSNRLIPLIFVIPL